MSEQLPPWLWPRAAYVHIPFCAYHCGYCDFAVATGADHLIDDYLSALACELATLETPQHVQTLFLGGGTPTHLSAEQLDRLFALLAKWLIVAPDGERSIEANPDSLSVEKIAVLAHWGINRVSLGGQSFRPELLQVLDRQHDPTQIVRAIERLRGRIPQVSLDLIFGVPGQSADHWRSDLHTALQLGVSHLSTYGLTYEKGTPLWKRRRAGRLYPLSEDEELHLYRLAIDELEAAGFEHYEISNFALPGARSRHNQIYWANEAYFGFGLGAARYVLGRREVNTRDLRGYIRKAQTGESVTQQAEELPPRERARETIAVQLRRAEGIDHLAFARQTGFELSEIASTALPFLIEQGWLVQQAGRTYLSRSGKYVADAVIERLL